MDADAFVERLRAIAPTVQQMLDARLAPSEAERFVRSFDCAQNSTITRLSSSRPLLDLVDRYDTTRLEIGMVRFCRPKEHLEHWRVGVVEADPLCIGKTSGNVYAVGANSAVIWNCASDESRFLNAMLLAAEYLAECAWNDRAFTDDERRKSVARQCAELAGGAEYAPFYRMLVGP